MFDHFDKVQSMFTQVAEMQKELENLEKEVHKDLPPEKVAEIKKMKDDCINSFHKGNMNIAEIIKPFLEKIKQEKDAN